MSYFITILKAKFACFINLCKSSIFLKVLKFLLINLLLELQKNVKILIFETLLKVKLEIHIFEFLKIIKNEYYKFTIRVEKFAENTK